MSRNHQAEIAREFLVASQQFREIRNQETRTSTCGQEFVLVDNVTQRLTSDSPICPPGYRDSLDWLRHTAYLRHRLQPPAMRSDQFEEYLPIFYTLLEIGAPELIHVFKDNGLEKLPFELADLESRIEPPPEHAGFQVEFYKRQFVWCPIRLDLNMGKILRQCISPFSRKRRITTSRDSQGMPENTATLYEIDVLEELVGPELQSCMTSARIDRKDRQEKERVPSGSVSKGHTYRFALKQFKVHKEINFTNEREMFANLRETEGMIRYIGWYSNYEPGADGVQQYFNIILELADSDFYDTILEESPPISFDEISGFWKSMSDVSRTLKLLHTVVIDQQEYAAWHGDIKPENILRVNDQFKLADPGEASMLLKQSGISTLPRSQVTRGTRTYASPEKAAYLARRKDSESAITQKSDVWSFGCVLSIAATFIVLGAQGFLIYKELRLLAKDERDDAFHDGKLVLGQVTNWHTYLREAARKTDPMTSAVLDMVDSHMLVPSKDRWEATRICEEFSRILESTQSVVSRVPPELLNLMETIDLEAEHHQDQRFGFTRVDSGDTLRRPRPSSIPSSETGGESRKKLSKKSIQPTAQRSRKTDGSPVQTPRPSLRLPVANQSVANHESFPHHASNVSIFTDNGQIPMSYHNNQAAGPAMAADSPVNFLEAPDVPGMKVGQVKHMLRKNGLTYKPNRKSLSSLLVKQQTTIKGIISNNERLDQRLEEEFRKRDIVFLVDNGASMASWWVQATELLEVLVWRALGYDDDGMELYFTNPDTKPKATIDSVTAQSVKKAVKKYTKAMELAEPMASGPTACKTTIIPQLERIINDYSMAKASKKTEERKKTIIVLTDGRWEGMHNEYSVDIYLRSAFHGLRDLHGDVPYIEGGHLQTGTDISKIRPVTIEFVQFGNDRRATERLRRLDDDMKLYGCPDFIDTEHAEGDIYKMFLGSLCWEFDRKKRYSLDPSSPPTMTTAGSPETYISTEQGHQSSYITSPITTTSRTQTMNSYANSPANFFPSQALFSPPPPQRHDSSSPLPVDPRDPRDPESAIFGRQSTWNTYNSTASGSRIPEGLVSSSQTGSSSQTQGHYSSQHTRHWDNR